MENMTENKSIMNNSDNTDLLNKSKQKTKPIVFAANSLVVRIVYAVLACLVLISTVTACGASEEPVIDVIQTPAAATATAAPEPTPVITPELTPEPTPETFGKPNIYLFVLDEYSSFDMLSKYYDYDAKVFNDFLISKGFNISRESYTTDNQTEHSICDLLNLDYISRRYSKSKCFRAISEAKLYDVFSELGYSQFQFSSSDGHFKGTPSLRSQEGLDAYAAITKQAGSFSGTVPTVPSELSAQLSEPEFGTKVDTASLNQWGVYSSDYIRNSKAYKANGSRSSASNMLKIFDYFENPNNYAPTSPRVIYSYMPATHVEFVFNEFGGILPYSQGRNWRDEEIYLGQYNFVNKHLMATVSTITANDPNSIIIIMSDHGIRYHADCTKMHKFYVTDKDSLRILNAVYIKGQKYDIEGLSAINTLRYILSLYEGHEQDYPPIKDPVTSESPNNLKGIIPRHRAPYKPPVPKPTDSEVPAPDPTVVPET